MGARWVVRAERDLELTVDWVDATSESPPRFSPRYEQFKPLHIVQEPQTKSGFSFFRGPALVNVNWILA